MLGREIGYRVDLTDDVGNDETNVKLSTRRAQSVMAFLVLRGVEFVFVDPPEFAPPPAPEPK